MAMSGSRRIVPRDEETERLLVEEMVMKICIFKNEEHRCDFLDELARHRTIKPWDQTPNSDGD